MGRYRLVFKKSVAKDLRGIPNRDVARILKCFEALSEDPRASGRERLSGLERYRARRGVYRIVYEIRDDVLLVGVARVGQRRDVHRGA